MIAPDYTIVVAVDDRYADQLRETYPTWVKHKPELLAQPLVVLADGRAGDRAWWGQRLSWLQHPVWSLVPWHWTPPDSDISQRERMLTSFVLSAPWNVETEYWLKLDCDTVASQGGVWIDPAWFADRPALVSNGWPYTKPASALTRLETWGDGHPILSKYPRLGLQVDPNAETFGHHRIISWLCFVNTAWSREVSCFAQERLPVPSQDTYHWYCATRMGRQVVTRNFKKMGWGHWHSRRTRSEKVRQALET